MGKSAILAIRIIGDATSAVSEMKKAEAASMSFKDHLGKAAAGATVALGAIGAGAVSCANSAADLQQSIGGVETVFGSSASKMLEWSNNAAQAVGLSKNEYNEFATLVGSQLQNMGMSVDESANKTNELIGLGADLSSMFGGTTAEAVDALSAALKGEMDPIEKYGITLNDSTLKAKAAEMGLTDLYKAGDRNAKMQATLAAITDQSGKSVGNFAKEADTAQGQQQRMAASFENAKAALGEALLPVITKAASKLAEFAKWASENSRILVPLIAVVGAVAAIIVVLNAAMTAYSAAATIAAVAQSALSTAFLPVIAVIIAVVVVVALLILNWDKVKEVGGKCVDWIARKWSEFTEWISGVWNSLTQWASDTWNKISETCKPAVDFITGCYQLLFNAVTLNFDGMKDAAKKMYDALPGWAQNAIDKVIAFFTGLKDKIAGIFDAIGGYIKNALDWVGDLWDKLTGASTAAATMPATASTASAMTMHAYHIALMSDMSNGPLTYTPMSTRAIASNISAGSIRPRSREGRATINITINSSGNLDNDATAGRIADALDTYFSRRGRKAFA